MAKKVRPTPEFVLRGITDPEKAARMLLAEKYFSKGFFDGTDRLFVVPEVAVSQPEFGAKPVFPKTSPYPVLLSQLIAIAHDCPTFLVAEQCAQAIAQCLVDINQWCAGFHDLTQGLDGMHSYFHVEPKPIHLPRTLLWSHPSTELLASELGLRWSWELSGWVVMNYLYALMPQTALNDFADPKKPLLTNLCHAWDDAATLIHPNHFHFPHWPFMTRLFPDDPFLYSFRKHQAQGYPTHKLPNPFQALIDMTKVCHHGGVGFAALTEEETAISIHMNVW